MGIYYINEYSDEMSLIELRLGGIKDCELYVQKITEILDFLRFHGFMAHLTVLFDDDKSAEDFLEFTDIPSLTIEICDGKFRFKYWNGKETIWTFHINDLFDALLNKRQEYVVLYTRYGAVTDIVMDAKNNFRTCIRRISYRYAVSEDIDIEYLIVFAASAEGMHEKILQQIHNRINDLNMLDLKYIINFDFETDECLPCQKKKQENKDEQ